MSFAMKASFGFAAKEDVLQLETRLSEMLTSKLRASLAAVKLPEDYKLFLLETNGGEPKKCIFQHESFGISGVHFYYGIFPDSDHRSILRNTSSMRSMGDKFGTLIEIATDPGGLSICLGISGNDDGKVFLFDHDSDCTDGSPPFICIANSFSEFFNGCYETDEEAEIAYNQSSAQRP